MEANLREAFQLLARRFGFLCENCCCCGEKEVSLMQSHILFEINRLHQPSVQEAANALGVELTTFSRQIKALVERGLVKKSPHPSDNRVQILGLTPEGSAVERRIHNQVNGMLQEVLSHLSDFERESVIRSIYLLNEAMQKSRTCCIPPR